MKLYHYYSLDYSGPPGAEGRIERIARELDAAHIRSVHEYGMTGGDLYRFVRTTLTKEELMQRLQDRCAVVPGNIRELPSDYKTLRDMTIEEEFKRVMKPKKSPINTASVGVCLDAGKWAFSKFNIGDTVRYKGVMKGKTGRVQFITVYPAMSYVFAYWIKGVGPSDVPEDELKLVKRGKR